MAETVEDPLQPINHNKTCVLKASIHCEGCKRKVKKILSQVQGVEHVDVDRKEQKVTVTGSVDADTLIKKLTKSGKHAQLWPQKPQKIASKEKLDTQRPAKPDQQAKPTSSNAAKVLEPSPKDEKREENGSPAEKAVSDAPAKTSGSSAVEVPKSDVGSKTEEGLSGEVKPPPQAAEAENGGEGLGGEGSGVKVVKKKKKKGQVGNSTSGVPAPRNIESGDPPISTNHSPPRHHHYYTPPPPAPTPVYGMSYNTAYPTSSYTASYYAAPEPYSSYAYTYPGPGTGIEPPPSDHHDHGTYPQQVPSDSFEMFSDENPNGCSIA